MRNDKNGEKSLSRREFFLRSAAATLAVSASPASMLAAPGQFHAIPDSPLPKRAFGKTGTKIPLLTFGCGSRFGMYDDEGAGKVINAAIDQGIIYLDTAHGYSNGHSEERIGMFVTPTRRKQVLLQTKIATRDPDQWWKDLELSLSRMKTDYVDMLLVHSLENDDDLEKVEVKGGPAELLFKAREQKLTRWIGASSHTNSSTLAKFLRRYPVDGVQMALNVATNGPFDMGFEETALPVAVEQGLGITAMKVMGQDLIVGKYEKYDYATCLRYSLSLPVTAATVGMPKPEHLSANLEVVRNFKPFTPEEMRKLKEQAQGEIQTSFFNHLRGHSDLA